MLNKLNKKYFLKLIDLFVSFSDEVDDKILLKILPEKGRYLGIGAHHPVKISNTYLLYLHGWYGINIDITNEKLFKRIRPRDKFIYGYVEADTSYCFPKELFTSDPMIAEKVVNKGSKCKITKDIPNISINRFKNYDLLDLDVDGIEVKILEKMEYNPPFIIVENMMPEQKGVDDLLYKQGYEKVAQTIHNGIFKL